MIRRIYVEKNKPYDTEAQALSQEIKNYLGVERDLSVRVLVRYDIENISDDVYEAALHTVFSEPPLDTYHEGKLEVHPNDHIFNVEYLPGQFDQRADSAIQCIKLINGKENPIIRTAKTYCINGKVFQDEMNRIKAYVMNPVDSRFVGDDIPDTLNLTFPKPRDIEIIKGFQDMKKAKLKRLFDAMNLAMTFADFQHIQEYYANVEKRNPTITEIKVLDTYWSDHCRHTTYLTHLTDVVFKDGYYKEPIENAWNKYLECRKAVYGAEADANEICLMDIALMGMKAIQKEGGIPDLEDSNEHNACSIVVPVKIKNYDGTEKIQEYLVMFKNETHNHPTEIEPFGGAATCLGGAIRDPLSGRSYVYQAMRITGAADPKQPVIQTMKGKLPQKKIVREAALGYSSYGNQIGLATGFVHEIYHLKYVAKRMEIGAVIAAAPKKNVRRANPEPGDVIILLGGRTGRDGIGGATGSSKAHTRESIDTCGAEVQKGNPPTERKIQRLFRRRDASLLIKVCNDFGAGGVAVAIGELAPGIKVDLNLVPKKYLGLDGTEVAISESQERMAVVVSARDESKFLRIAAEENLEATKVAIVTRDPRLVFLWHGRRIVDISRKFLDTNGASQEAKVEVQVASDKTSYFRDEIEIKDERANWLAVIGSLAECSEQGLVEMFDSTIGAGTVLMPYGGQFQLSPTQVMAALIPVESGQSEIATIMAYGFDPTISSWSPYHGSVYAVIDAVAKTVAAGGHMDRIRFTLQEYYQKMSNDKKRWSTPFTSLLGAFDAQMALGLPAIGGKDSMSGTYEKIDVPPTLVAFAVSTVEAENIISPELKKAGNVVVKFSIPIDEYDLPDYEQVKILYKRIEEAIASGTIVSAYALTEMGIAPAISKMAFGNGLGVQIYDNILPEEMFLSETGNILAEVTNTQELDELQLIYTYIGEVTEERFLVHKDVKLSLEEVFKAYSSNLEGVFPTRVSRDRKEVESPLYQCDSIYVCTHKTPKPKVFIPVFPGTNCEYDLTRAFERAGAEVETKVFRNLSPKDIIDSVEAFRKCILGAQILMMPGGFSAGDEPDGSAKFFAAAFRNEAIKEAVMDLINNRDGLVLGICNGFQALIKLGLLPYGEIKPAQETDSPTLTFNTINRHISKMAYMRVVSNKSPWLSGAKLGGIYVNPASHGEGRFVASEEWLSSLFERGMVATQYSDPFGHVSMDEAWNFNGSFRAIEGITSEDGRIFGKMVHAERSGENIAKNIVGNQDMQIFESGVRYFSD